MSDKLEKLIEYIINDETEKARELFHQYVVENSRDIYNQVVAEEDKEEDENEEHVDETIVDEFSTDQSDDMMGDIAADEEGMSDDSEESDDDSFDFDDDETDMSGGEEGLEDRVVDLEDALDELKAEFDRLMADEMDEPEHQDLAADDEMSSDDMSSEEVEQVDEISPATAHSYRSKSIDQMRKGLKPGEKRELSDIDKKNIINAANRTDSDYYNKKGQGMPKESMVREYTEKVNVSHTDGTDSKASKSIVASKNDMGGSAKNIVQGGEEKGGSAPKPGNMGAVDPRAAGKSAFAKKAPTPTTKDGASSTKSPVA